MSQFERYIGIDYSGAETPTVAAWLQRADVNGSVPRYFDPPLTPEEREIAKVEGWILGVV